MRKCNLSLDSVLMPGLIGLFLMCFGTIASQPRPLAFFPKTQISFDTIPEEGGPVTKRFIVYNKGDIGLRLLDVKPGCGCTTSDWVKTPIQPADSGFIDVVYDPAQRPGLFNKHIAVNTNDPDRTTMFLNITGFVTPRPKTIEELYPIASGSLRFVSTHITLGNAYLGQVYQDTFFLINTSQDAVKIIPSRLPEFVSLKLIPSEINPGEKAIILLNYFPSKRNDWGVLFDTISFFTDDTQEALKKISVGVKVLEDFTKLSVTDSQNLYPRLEIPKSSFQFAPANKGDVIHHEFVLKNSGQSDLIMRKLSSSCPCIQWEEIPNVIHPSDSVILKASFNTSGYSGSQHKTITLITNDPNRQEIYLSFIGTVN